MAILKAQFSSILSEFDVEEVSPRLGWLTSFLSKGMSGASPSLHLF